MDFILVHHKEMQRYLDTFVRRDLDSGKLVFLAGPRQVGKTTLARSLFPESTTYLNYDDPDDRKIIRDRSWPRAEELVVFDELHKMRGWKQWIKGQWDTARIGKRILVTGSARLDIFRRGGDSLAGRVFHFRLHPFSVKELVESMAPAEVLDRLLRVGGFPEPFLDGTDAYAARWRRMHLDRILREDLLSIEMVRDVGKLELLVDLLSDRVGSPISYANLAADLEVAPATVKRWIAMLESMFVVFVVTPYSRKIAKAILKEPKVYFYDTGRVVDRPDARLENVVACALLKRNAFLEDTLGARLSLHYVRDKLKHEVDFLTVRERKPEMLVEVKLADDKPSGSLKRFAARLGPIKAVQLVGTVKRALDYDGIDVVPAAAWLTKLEA